MLRPRLLLRLMRVDVDDDSVGRDPSRHRATRMYVVPRLRAAGVAAPTRREPLLLQLCESHVDVLHWQRAVLDDALDGDEEAL